jgi:NAD kinase
MKRISPKSYHLIFNNFTGKKNPQLLKLIIDNFNLVKNISDSNAIMVLGGDGSLLKAIHNYK